MNLLRYSQNARHGDSSGGVCAENKGNMNEHKTNTFVDCPHPAPQMIFCKKTCRIYATNLANLFPARPAPPEIEVRPDGESVWLGVMAEVKLMLRRRLGQHSMILHIYPRLINHLHSLMSLLFCHACRSSSSGKR